MSNSELTEQQRSLKREYLSHWISEDGLGLLSYHGDRAPCEGFHRRTAGNDNGILFITYFYYICYTRDIVDTEDSTRFLRAVKDLQVEPGLYNRNPGRDDGPDALDNYVAIAAGSALFGLPFAADLVDYGVRHGWTYDNTRPGVFSLRRWRQASDVAHYKISAFYPPAIWEWIWLVGGIIHNSFQKEGTTSEHLMTWLRLKSIDIIHNRKGKGCHWEWMFNGVSLAGKFWQWRLKKKTKGLGIFRIIDLYFGGRNPPNPMVELAKGMLF